MAHKKTKRQPNQICFTGSRIGELNLSDPNELEESERLQKIMEEFMTGFHFLRNYGLTATFFGSARYGFEHALYQEATKLAYQLSMAGFAIITGGGPGIMEAANRGAWQAGGQSAGLNIRLKAEQRTNEYVKESAAFYYFFVRKVMLAFASEVYVFFPGGFGTLDEFFEIVTLVQTKKIEPVPIILIGKDYWSPLLTWIEQNLYETYEAIAKDDMKIYQLVENADEAFDAISQMVKQ